MSNRASNERVSNGEAAAVARDKLSDQYGRKWSGGRKRPVACDVRTSRRTVGCRATWTRGHVRYTAHVVVREWTDWYRVSAKIASRRRA